jgi:hypothetical protein
MLRRGGGRRLRGGDDSPPPARQAAHLSRCVSAAWLLPRGHSRLAWREWAEPGSAARRRKRSGTCGLESGTLGLVAGRVWSGRYFPATSNSQLTTENDGEVPEKMKRAKANDPFLSFQQRPTGALFRDGAQVPEPLHAPGGISNAPPLKLRSAGGRSILSVGDGAVRFQSSARPKAPRGLAASAPPLSPACIPPPPHTAGPRSIASRPCPPAQVGLWIREEPGSQLQV